MPRKKKVTEKPMTLGLRGAKSGNDRQMIPADNVDADGTAWATVGENIRKGSRKATTKEDVLDAISALLGVEVTIEEVTATISNDGRKIEVDNDLFVGHASKIVAINKIIIAFFIINCDTKNGAMDIYLSSTIDKNSSIHLARSSETGVSSKIKFAVLVE